MARYIMKRLIVIIIILFFISSVISIKSEYRLACYLWIDDRQVEVVLSEWMNKDRFDIVFTIMKGKVPGVLLKEERNYHLSLLPVINENF